MSEKEGFFHRFLKQSGKPTTGEHIAGPMPILEEGEKEEIAKRADRVAKLVGMTDGGIFVRDRVALEEEFLAASGEERAKWLLAIGGVAQAWEEAKARDTESFLEAHTATPYRRAKALHEWAEKNR